LLCVFVLCMVDCCRDGLGRFVVGWGGGPGRPRSWLSGVEFAGRYPFLCVVAPGVCPMCGGCDYRFNVRFDGRNCFSLRCKCNVCGAVRHYRAFSGSWGSI